MPDRRDTTLLSADPAMRKRVAGAVLIGAIAAFVAYIGMYRPVHEALESGGALRYYTKGVVLPPVLLYVAVLMVTVDVRDGQIFTVNAKNKRTLTPKGWWVALGACAVGAAALGGWTLYLRALGFHSA